ncbi:putative RNA recognition motif domain, nucleotide-binding alpha-beta plait domain superfamily [Helianthus anomalus]
MEMESGKLFIGGISWDTSEERMKEYFQTFNEVIEAVIMKDRTTGRAHGFGFVVFSDPVVVEKVVKEKHMIDGRSVSCYMLKHMIEAVAFECRLEDRDLLLFSLYGICIHIPSNFSTCVFLLLRYIINVLLPYANVDMFDNLNILLKHQNK